MTAYPAWTPASRPGHHPAASARRSARSSAARSRRCARTRGAARASRSCVQTLAYHRRARRRRRASRSRRSRAWTRSATGTEEFEAVMAGSIALTGIAGVRAGPGRGRPRRHRPGRRRERGRARRGRREADPRALWRRVKPVVWRLIGYSLLLTVAVIVLDRGRRGGDHRDRLSPRSRRRDRPRRCSSILGAIPLTLWLSTKLLLVPATIILERATIRGAIARSWTPHPRHGSGPRSGVIVIISLDVRRDRAGRQHPLLASSATALTTIVAPTGDPTPSAIIGDRRHGAS